MDRFRQIFEYTKAHLGQMSPTQKMLIGSAVIIMAMTLFIVNEYAGRSDMMSLPIDSSSAAESATLLQRVGIQATTSGSDVRVASEDYMRAIQTLSQGGMMGADAIQTLMKTIQEQPWWAPSAQNQQAMNAAISQTLSTIVSGWSYVSRATVIVQSPVRRPMIGMKEPSPTASAEVRPKGSGTLTDEQVRGIADFISGAVPDLDPEDIKVIDANTGRSMRVKNQDSFSASNYTELRSLVENEYEEGIYALLASIPNVVVVVNAQIDTRMEQRFERDYKKENSGSVLMPDSERSSSLEETNAPSGSGAGVQPNTGLSVSNRSSGTTTGRTSSESNTTFKPAVGMSEANITDPKGYATMVRAAIAVPRSFYVRIWESQNPEASEPPDDTALDPIITKENQKIIDLVSEVIDTSAVSSLGAKGVSAASSPGGASGASTGNGEVTVQMIYDTMGLGGSPGFGAQEAGAGGGILSFVGDGVLSGSVKTIAVSVLGLFSLFLMFRLIRGATTRRQLPTAEELVGIPPTLGPEDDDLIGTASGTEPAMDALELDEDELRSRNLLEQVEEMVNSNPNDSARLIAKWAAGD